MTNRNLTRPNPSHPSSRNIIWGIKISRFIDIIKRNIISRNCPFSFSWFIYLLENRRTFAEIKQTVAENNSPGLSRINGKLIFIADTISKLHSNSIISLFKSIIIVEAISTVKAKKNVKDR